MLIFGELGMVHDYNIHEEAGLSYDALLYVHIINKLLFILQSEWPKQKSQEGTSWLLTVTSHTDCIMWSYTNVIMIGAFQLFIMMYVCREM